MHYKHTQTNRATVAASLLLLAYFIWLYVTAAAEPQSPDSGTNLAVTAIMTLLVYTVASFSTLHVEVSDKKLQIKFGHGIFKKSFLLNDIASAKVVRNHWYYGWGIRRWFWPKMWIFNVAGLNAVEIKMKNGKVYRIGTDDEKELVRVLSKQKT